MTTYARAYLTTDSCLFVFVCLFVSNLDLIPQFSFVLVFDGRDSKECAGSVVWWSSKSPAGGTFAAL